MHNVHFASFDIYAQCTFRNTMVPCFPQKDMQLEVDEITRLGNNGRTVVEVEVPDCLRPGLILQSTSPPPLLSKEPPSVVSSYFPPRLAPLLPPPSSCISAEDAAEDRVLTAVDPIFSSGRHTLSLPSPPSLISGTVGEQRSSWEGAGGERDLHDIETDVGRGVMDLERVPLSLVLSLTSTPQSVEEAAGSATMPLESLRSFSSFVTMSSLS